VEYEIDKKLGIKSKSDVLNMGIGVYNEECRKIVMRYSREWEQTITRSGRWIDFRHDYKTLDLNFMESVWWVFKTLYDKNLVYRGFKVMPYSTACNTPISNFEAGLDYRDVSDPAVLVSFPVIDCDVKSSFVAWTTTPWTLPSNLALCLNPQFIYVYLKDPHGTIFIVAKSCISMIPGAMNKKKKLSDGWQICKEVAGKELKDLRYRPLFSIFEAEMKDTAFRVCVDDYVTEGSGTGVVHQAPAYGEDDYRVCLAHGIISKGGMLPDPVDDNGSFCSPIPEILIGRNVKDADKDIIKILKEMNRLVDSSRIVHSYPFCWRSHTPLIYKAVASYFVKVEDLKEKLLENNKQTHWVPSHVKEKRFHNWLENVHDWSISRNRFWGTPIPVWTSPDGEEIRVIGSVEELERLSGEKVSDLHRHFIDHLEIPSSRGTNYPSLRRVEDVFDCWFESGSMPYAQQHYPFENIQYFEKNFPADFVAEGLDQTRGWFYTLMVLSTALFDRPAFKNLICNGLVLASDGKKMSKSLKNYPDPSKILNEYGADALRLYLINSPVVRAEPLRFKEEGVFSILKNVFLPWYNAYRFLVQNVRRVEKETQVLFIPDTLSDTKLNVLDRWIISESNTLVAFIRAEMEGYRLYTVVPRLINFIEQLTNIYVRFNRGRLKGKDGEADCQAALSVLFHVLVLLCRAMSPFTPFFVEKMYQNLKNCLEISQNSIHFESFPEVQESAYDVRIEASVKCMQNIIELGRTVRERKKMPLKLPLSSMTIVHKDAVLLQDIFSSLKSYITSELNVRDICISSNPLQYADLRAEPNFNLLGKRLGKKMGSISKIIKNMSTETVMAFQADEAITIEDEIINIGEVVLRYEFKDLSTSDNVEAILGEDGLMILMDMEVHEELLDACIAREIVNRIQKLRKQISLKIDDDVRIYYQIIPGQSKKLSDDLMRVLTTFETYFDENLGTIPEAESERNSKVLLVQESVTLSSGISFELKLCKPVVKVDSKLLLETCNHDVDLYTSFKTLILSREYSNFLSEFQKSNNTVTLECNGKHINVQIGKEIQF